MKYFYGCKRKRSYFEGWYLKHQTATDTLAFVIAFHLDQQGRQSASLQIITSHFSYRIRYPADAFFASKKRFYIRIGHSIFTRRGCLIRIQTKDFSLQGKIRYKAFHAPLFSMMGPFCCIPFLQCYHETFSLAHRLTGYLNWNKDTIDFKNGIGYMEGDRGTSFPSRYIWTQCNPDPASPFSIVAAAATIPFLWTSFTGCFASILYKGKEYRFGTYLGAKIFAFSDRMLIITQKDMCLKIKLLQANPYFLLAPAKGHMNRKIQESLVCKVRYRMIYKHQLLFDLVSDQSSFEYSS